MKPLFAWLVSAVGTALGLAGLAKLLDERDRKREVQGDPDFVLWPELAAGKHHVCDLSLCRVLLMDDANYPCWLVLVPRRNALREVTDLPAALQEQLWREVAAASTALQELFQPFKINIAAIGNVVSQLHVHVTGRLEGDLAWPGPCYGAVPAVPLTQARKEFMLGALRKSLSHLRRSTAR